MNAALGGFENEEIGINMDSHNRPRSITSPGISDVSAHTKLLQRSNSVGEKTHSSSEKVAGHDMSLNFNDVNAESRSGQSVLISPEDQQLSLEINDFTIKADGLLARVESRRIGYNKFKSMKKKASAIKHTIKNGFADIAGMLSGRKNERRSKLDELKELTDENVIKYEELSNLFMARIDVALNVQQSLIEQSNIYKARLKSCLKYNNEKSIELKNKFDNAFQFIAELDYNMKGCLASLKMQESLNHLANIVPSDNDYVPWALRSVEEDPIVKAKKEEKKIEDEKFYQEIIEGFNTRMKRFKAAHNSVSGFMSSLMKSREKIEETIGRLNTTLRHLNYASGAAGSKDANADDEEDDDEVIIRASSPSLSFVYDHDDCDDCNVVHDITEVCGTHLLAAKAKAEENAIVLNDLLVRGEALRSAKVEIAENFTAWGDLPQSYSGGVYN
jgi:hypothetical protein